MRKSERPAAETPTESAPARYEVIIEAVGFALRGERLAEPPDIDIERLLELGAIRAIEAPACPEEGSTPI